VSTVQEFAADVVVERHPTGQKRFVLTEAVQRPQMILVGAGRIPGLAVEGRQVSQTLPDGHGIPAGLVEGQDTFEQWCGLVR
jgi:hypothetical protein